MSPSATSIDVSICIATCERPDGLAALLDSIGTLKCPEAVRVEVIVVDNARESERVEPGARRACTGLHPVTWLVEPRRGISHARNRGVDAAKGRWIGFVDDDEVLHEDWLSAHWACVHREGCDGAFGPVVPRLEPGGVGWFDPAPFFTRRPHRDGEVLSLRGLHTCNALVKRAPLASGAFDPAFGTSGGEDTQRFLRLVDAGARFVWCDDALVYESIPVARQRLRWLLSRAFRGGQQFERIEVERARRRRSRWPVLLVAAATSFLRGLLRLPFAAQRGVEDLLAASMRLGRVHVALGGTLSDGYGSP